MDPRVSSHALDVFMRGAGDHCGGGGAAKRLVLLALDACGSDESRGDYGSSDDHAKFDVLRLHGGAAVDRIKNAARHALERQNRF